MCYTVLKTKSGTIRLLLRVTGNFVASFPIVPYEDLFYCNLELANIEAAVRSKDKF